MYSEKLSTYYDDIYAQKDYKFECDLILKYSKTKDNLLDIGCGTMTHSIILSDFFKDVLSTDLSAPMINVGIKKITEKGINNVTTFNGPISDIKLNMSYDTIISMFNVVNHINSINDLIFYFKTISNFLSKDGVFIFDCWNGTACRIDPPKEIMEKSIPHNLYTLLTKTKTETNLFESWSLMNTEVILYFENKLVDNFSFSLLQKLWTPEVLKDICEMCGLSVIKIIPYFDDSRLANEKDYKITFICEKLN
jgi:SAM-dependent methyltransferase